MQYPENSVICATFISRPNRFIAHCLVDGTEVVCHVKNTGRCRELLLPGAQVYLCRAVDGAARKTAYDLIAVRKGERLINMDSQSPNLAAAEFLRKRYPTVQAEVKYGMSRVDFLVTDVDGKKTFVEVKGVTLEKDGVVRFPDAPTERGVKHLRELGQALSDGYGAAVLFVIQMENVRYFTPNDETDGIFGTVLREVHASGVEIWAYDCAVTPDSMVLDKAVEVRL